MNDLKYWGFIKPHVLRVSFVLPYQVSVKKSKGT